MPAPWPGMSGVKLAIKALLQDGVEYQERLTAVAEEFDDAIALKPAEYIYTAERDSLDGFPAIEMHAVSAEPVSGGRQSADQRGHILVLAVHILGDTEEGVQHEVERHILALRWLFRDRILTDVADVMPLIVGREDYVPIGRQKPGASTFQVAGALEIIVPTIE